MISKNGSSFERVSTIYRKITLYCNLPDFPTRALSLLSSPEAEQMSWYAGANNGFLEASIGCVCEIVKLPELL